MVSVYYWVLFVKIWFWFINVLAGRILFFIILLLLSRILLRVGMCMKIGMFILGLVSFMRGRGNFGKLRCIWLKFCRLFNLVIVVWIRGLCFIIW